MTNASTIRTFVAIDVGDEIRRRTAELVETLRAAGATVTWVKSHNMHLTLKFLGDVKAEVVPQVCDAVRMASASVAPFQLQIRGAARFSKERAPRDNLARRRLGERQSRQPGRSHRGGHGQAGLSAGRPQLSSPSHPRPRPGRRPGQPGVGKLLLANAGFEAGQVEIAETIVFSSELHPTGPTYKALCRAKLGAT